MIEKMESEGIVGPSDGTSARARCSSAVSSNSHPASMSLPRPGWRSMNLKDLEALLGAIRTGELSVAQGVERLRDLPFENAGVALIDHHRTLRQGVPETILGEGKTAEQIASIVARMAARGNNVLATRWLRTRGSSCAAITRWRV